MELKALSTCIVTERIDLAREFYPRAFAARISFDCGWYLNLEFPGGASLQFMAPKPDYPALNPAGLMLNFETADVDAEYARLSGLGVKTLSEPEDHSWGDRGFALEDPLGLRLYIYSLREPSPEFARYYR